MWAGSDASGPWVGSSASTVAFRGRYSLSGWEPFLFRGRQHTAKAKWEDTPQLTPARGLQTPDSLGKTAGGLQGWAGKAMHARCSAPDWSDAQLAPPNSPETLLPPDTAFGQTRLQQPSSPPQRVWERSPEAQMEGTREAGTLHSWAFPARHWREGPSEHQHQQEEKKPRLNHPKPSPGCLAT